MAQKKPTLGRGQRKALGVLRDAEHVLGTREGDVQGDGLGPLGLAVGVPLERLLPPALRVTLLQLQHISQTDPLTCGGIRYCVGTARQK